MRCFPSLQPGFTARTPHCVRVCPLGRIYSRIKKEEGGVYSPMPLPLYPTILPVIPSANYPLSHRFACKQLDNSPALVYNDSGG